MRSRQEAVEIDVLRDAADLPTGGLGDVLPPAIGTILTLGGGWLADHQDEETARRTAEAARGRGNAHDPGRAVGTVRPPPSNRPSYAGATGSLPVGGPANPELLHADSAIVGAALFATDLVVQAVDAALWAVGRECASPEGFSVTVRRSSEP